MTGQSLEHALSDRGLPAMPAVVGALLESAQRDGNATDAEMWCGVDPALAFAVLESVNVERPAPERTGRLSEAVLVLGLERCRNVVLGVPVGLDRPADPDAVDFDFTTFRMRAIRGSVAARLLAQFTKAHDPGEAAVAALLQDIGMVAMHRAFGDRYLQVLDIAGLDHRNLGEVEQRTLRIDHALVGGELASRACLPATIVSAIRHHHRPSAASREDRPFASLLELASVAAIAVEGHGVHAEEATARFRRAALASFAVSPHEALILLEEIRAESAHRLTLAGIGVPSDPEALARRIDEARRAAGLLPSVPAAHACTHDAITGLPDRESCLERLDSALGVGRAPGSAVAMLVVSIDDLRGINLRIGVRGGDVVLRTVARRIASALPAGATAFRLIGSQFAILAPGQSPLETRGLADELRRTISSEPIDIAGERAIRVTISVGVNVDRFAPEHPAADVTEVRENLIRGTLRALASAESAGRNRTEVFRDGRDAA